MNLAEQKLHNMEVLDEMIAKWRASIISIQVDGTYTDQDGEVVEVDWFEREEQIGNFRKGLEKLRATKIKFMGCN